MSRSISSGYRLCLAVVGLVALAGTAGANDFYVDDGFAGAAVNDPVVFTFPDSSTANATFGVNAFATIQDGINAAAANDTVFVAAGEYLTPPAPDPYIYINKALSVVGPNTGVAGDATRNPEATIRGTTVELNTATANPIVYTDVADVTFDGFQIDGNNPALTSGVIMNGVDVDRCFGLYVGGAGLENNLTLTNNIWRNIQGDAINVYGDTSSPTFNTTGLEISGSWFDNMSCTSPNGHGIVAQYNIYGTISDNKFTRNFISVQTGNYFRTNPTGVIIEDNVIEGNRLGVWVNAHYSAAPEFIVRNNEASKHPASVQQFWALQVSTQQNSTATCTFIDNYVHNADIGFRAWANPGARQPSWLGGTIETCGTGIQLDDFDNTYGAAAISNVLIRNTTVQDCALGVEILGFSSTNLQTMNLWSTNIFSCTDGVKVLDADGRLFMRDCQLTAATAGVGTGVEVSNIGPAGVQGSVIGSIIRDYGTGVRFNGPTTITGNDFFDNTISISVLANALGSKATYNNLVGAGTHLANNDSSNPLNAQSNWWGDAGGPSGGDLAGAGTSNTGFFLTQFQRVADSDGDGLYNGEEDLDANQVVDVAESNKDNKDTDADLIEDGVEVAIGTNPILNTSPGAFTDVDADGVPSTSDPNDNDTDSDDDGFLDFYEIALRSFANDASRVPSLGNVDGIDDLDFIDGVITGNAFLGNFLFEDFYHNRMDLDRNGQVLSNDAALIFNFHLNNIDELPAN